MAGAGLLRITAKGEAKLREAGPHWRKAEARMQSALGEARLKSLHDLLDRAAAGLQRLINGAFRLCTFPSINAAKNKCICIDIGGKSCRSIFSA